MQSFQQFFELGMKRRVKPLLAPLWNGGSDDTIVLDLGAGNTPAPGAVPMDLPHWNADEDRLPFDNEQVDFIHAYHFLEHVKDPIRMLREIERVLKPGGILQCVVPYYSAQIAVQDLDHKSFWSEDTWKTLFANPYYEKNREVKWRLRVHFCMIAGIVERNLALFTQLVKEP